MAKDPATLWYWNDWQGGTITMSRHLKGCYMDVLHAQFNVGHLSLDEIKNVLGNDFANWGILSKKFIQDSNGLWFNEKADETKNKRKAFSESRRKNLKGNVEAMGVHMEIEIENRKLEFKNEVFKFNSQYNDNLIIGFYNYWSESNGKKLRWELEKTFEVEKRLFTWKNNSIKWNKTSENIGSSGIIDKNKDFGKPK